jgi:hypothetical protein
LASVQWASAAIHAARAAAEAPWGETRLR